MKHPPFIIRVAASGTLNTLKFLSSNSFVTFYKAVVFPAQGPPVKHILYTGYSPVSNLGKFYESLNEAICSPFGEAGGDLERDSILESLSHSSSI